MTVGLEAGDGHHLVGFVERRHVGLDVREPHALEQLGQHGTLHPVGPGEFEYAYFLQACSYYVPLVVAGHGPGCTIFGELSVSLGILVRLAPGRARGDSLGYASSRLVCR